MYSPKYAIETDRKIIDEVILENPFATLVYQENGIPQSLHLPLSLEDNKLTGHLAKANRAWSNLSNSSALVIFHGPHCYISPTWYGAPNNVPTWNYISIQIRGKVCIHHDETFLRKTLALLGKRHDSTFNMENNIDDNQKLLLSIVGIEISVDEILATFKLAQSKTVEERKNVITVLQNSPKSIDQEVARAMLKTLRSL